MPIRKAKQINLLPLDDFESSTFGRILKWALSSFRVMVIITELVVMSAFLSRFWLDARNSDLNDGINVNKSQVVAFEDVEKNLRNYQKKLSISREMYLDPNHSEIVEEISKYMPEDITLSSIQKNNNGIQIKASSLSESSIAQFLVNLTSNNNYTDVNLSQVASSVDNSFVTTFTITATYNKK